MNGVSSFAMSGGSAAVWRIHGKFGRDTVPVVNTGRVSVDYVIRH